MESRCGGGQLAAGRGVVPHASGISSTPAQDRTGLLFLGGYFLLFCALVLAGGGGWSAYRTDVESSRWPAVAARLSDCRVHTSYDGWHGRARALHHVECSFQYDVDARSYRVRSKVGDMLSIVRGQIELTRSTVTLASLEEWVKHHPTGTVETIHYDPVHPDRISLVGMEDDIKWQTTAGYVHGALVFAVLGAGLLLTGTLFRRSAARRAV